MAIKNKDFLYGSHLPVLQAIFNIFEPLNVVEFGAGLNSTVFFANNSKKVLSIETEIEWYNKMKVLEENHNNLEMIYHRIGGGVHRKTKDIPKSVKADVLKFYRSILNEDYNGLMFVDHVSGLRAFTIAQLYKRFSIVVYHDAQGKGYRYDSLNKLDLSRYYHFVHRTFEVHTGVLINKNIIVDAKDFLKEVKLCEQEYCNKFDYRDYKFVMDTI